MRFLPAMGILLVLVSAGCRSERRRRVAAAEHQLLTQAVDLDCFDLAQLDDWNIALLTTEPAELPPKRQSLSTPPSLASYDYELRKSQDRLWLFCRYNGVFAWHPEVTEVRYRPGGLQLTVLWRFHGHRFAKDSAARRAVADDAPHYGDTVRCPVLVDLERYEGMSWYKQDGERGRSIAQFTAQLHRVPLVDPARAAGMEEPGDAEPVLEMDTAVAVELVQSWLLLHQDAPEEMLNQASWAQHARWIDALIDELLRRDRLVAIECEAPIEEPAWQSFVALQERDGFPSISSSPSAADLGQAPKPARWTIVCLPRQVETIRLILQGGETKLVE